MGRGCHCSGHHGYIVHRHCTAKAAQATEDPSPAWPLVLLFVVCLLIIVPTFIEPPEITINGGIFVMVIPFLCLLGLVGLLFLLPPGEDSSSTPTHSTSTICHSHYVPRPQYRCYKHAHYR